MSVLTDPLAAKILASIITISSPGDTIFSQVPIPICDDSCQQTNLCNNLRDWKCRKPKFDKDLNYKYLKLFESRGMSQELAEKEAKIRSFTRPETYDEALVRYAIIAEAISNVSGKLTTGVCRNKCNNDAECQKQCFISSPWTWKQSELAFMILVAANQESGFRADVHGGTGEYGLGDCKWKNKDGKDAVPFSKGAYPVKETCQSFCLGQIKVGKGTTINNWSADDLIGIDSDSTERCITVTADYMTKSRIRCTKWNKITNENNWAKATFSAYGSGLSCNLYQSKMVDNEKQYAYNVKTDNGIEVVWSSFVPDNATSKVPVEEMWPVAREKMFFKLLKREPHLSDDTIAKINAPEFISTYELLKSGRRISWMVPLGSSEQEIGN
jgi:hypothetical protein